jgi:hypothetical protein
LAAVRIALLIDGENVAAQHFPAIAKKVGKLGQPVVRRLFGLSKDWEAVARDKALKVEWQPSGGKGKNTVDIAMAVHAMDIVHRGLADAICLVSSDCDFQPLAVHLREAGMTVYGMGEEKTDGSLREAYTEFHVLTKPNTTTMQPKAKAPAAQAPVKTPKLATSDGDTDVIARLMPQDGDWKLLATLGSELQSAHPAISARLKGKNRLAKHLEAIPRFEKRVSGTVVEFRLKPVARPASAAP